MRQLLALFLAASVALMGHSPAQAVRQADRLSLLRDVALTSITTGQPLVYSGSAWVNTALGWSMITGTPTTLGGYGITDAAALSHTHAFASLTSKPTTLAGYGITDAFSGAFSSLSGTPTTLAGYGITDAAALSHTHTFASLTSKPTTLSGYGITDAFSGAFSALTGKPTTLSGYGVTDAAALSHTHTFASLTSKPTTISGYGITDAQPLDSDLTAIAALSTTAYGRSLLTQADATATRTTLGAGTSNFDGAFSSLSGTPTTLAGYGITDGGGGAAISSASGTLGKVVEPTAATLTLDCDGLATWFSGLPAGFSYGGGSLAISGTGITTFTLTFTQRGDDTGGWGTAPGIIYVGINPDTNGVESITDASLIAYFIAAITPVGFTVLDAGSNLVGFTGATGASSTITLASTNLGGFGNATASGTDGSGSRQVELAAAVGGKAHRLHNASFAVGGATAWVTADVQLGYYDGATFSPVLKIPLASLSGNAAGFNGGGGFTLEGIANLITPVIGNSLVARTAISGSAGDETTGDNVTIYVTYSDE